MRAGLVVGAAVLMMSGCVLKDRYRYVQLQPSCFATPPDTVPGNPNEHRPFPSIDCRSALYKTAFVEFGEDGSLIDPLEAAKALVLIDSEKARAGGGKIIALLYVHGWKNNADQVAPGQGPQDVERFNTALSELGYRASMASPQKPVPVVGIYIGWKGKSLMGPSAFTFVSYWGRRNTANRVGGKTLASLINSVIDRAVPTPTDPSRVMLVGHSFGARALEHAIENGVELWPPGAGVPAAPIRPRVDLVLYINEANDSRLSLGRIEGLQKAPIAVRHPDFDPAACQPVTTGDPTCNTYPLIVALTSRGDQATKLLQPLANTLNFDGDSAPMPPLPTGPFLDGPPSKKQVEHTAPGHFSFLQSHVATEIPCPIDPQAAPGCAPNDSACAFAFRARGDCTACFKVSKRQSSGARMPFNDTAYWIMDIDARVIKDHGDIWNLSTLGLIGAMLSPRGFFEPGTARMQIRPSSN